MIVGLVAFVVLLARHDTGSELIEVRGKPRRFFLLTLTKFVRELRALDRAERLRIADEACKKYGYRWAGERIVVMVGGVFASMFLWGCAGSVIWPRFVRWLWLTFGGDRFFWEDQSTLWYAVAVAITTTIIWCFVFVMQVQFAVRKRVDDFRCPHCKYSLVGLAKDGTVLCPECGKTSRVVTRGMSAYKVVVPLDHVFVD